MAKKQKPGAVTSVAVKAETLVKLKEIAAGDTPAAALEKLIDRAHWLRVGRLRSVSK